MNNTISQFKQLQRTTPDGSGAQTSMCVLEHYVCLLPSLVVHDHLTKVILIGIIFIPQILHWSLVIGGILIYFE